VSAWDALPVRSKQLFADSLFEDSSSETVSRSVFEAICEELPPGQAEDFIGALKSFGSKLPGLVKDVAPGIIKGATTGASVGGPWGALVGALAGGATSAFQKAGSPRASAPPQMIMNPPVVPQSPIANQSKVELGANLAMLLQNPALMQSITSLMAGDAGKPSIAVGDKQVNPAAILNALKVLSEQAMMELNERSGASEEGLEYLMSAEGEMIGEAADPIARADAVLSLLCAETAYPPVEAYAQDRASGFDTIEAIDIEAVDESFSDLFEAEGKPILQLVRFGGPAFIQTAQGGAKRILGFEYSYFDGIEHCRPVGAGDQAWKPVLGYRGMLFVIMPDGSNRGFSTIERGSAHGRKDVPDQNWAHLPPGEYTVRMAHSKLLQDYFRILNRRGSTPFLIHVGNNPSDSSGCILPGLRPSGSGVESSRTALNQIAAMLGGWRLDQEFKLQIKGYHEEAGKFENPEVQSEEESVIEWIMA
jgi:hypothetical protein